MVVSAEVWIQEQRPQICEGILLQHAKNKNSFKSDSVEQTSTTTASKEWSNNFLHIIALSMLMVLSFDLFFLINWCFRLHLLRTYQQFLVCSIVLWISCSRATKSFLPGIYQNQYLLFDMIVRLQICIIYAIRNLQRKWIAKALWSNQIMEEAYIPSFLLFSPSHGGGLSLLHAYEQYLHNSL